MYLVRDTPIRKNKKTYGVGEEYPYSDKDKKLLWNLTAVTEPGRSEVEETKKATPNLSAKSSKAEDGPPKKVDPKVTEKKTVTASKNKPTAKKKVVTKKKK